MAFSATASAPRVVSGECEGLRSVTLVAPAADTEATFVPEAGMVCSSLRHAGEELLARSDGVRAYVADGTTLGIPFLHPWANRLGGWSYRALGRAVDLRRAAAVVPTDEHGLPIHGVLPRTWTLLAAGAAGGAARLWAELDATADPALLAAFPYPHHVRLDVALRGATLRVRTTVRALRGPVPVAHGFHPWIALPGVARNRWHVTLPVRRRVVLDDRMVPSGAFERAEPWAGPLAERFLDDGFDRLARPAVFAVRGAGRRVSVAFEQGFPVAQVYAPPERDVVCFEPMTAPADALRAGGFALAAPGAPHVATFSVRVAGA